MYLYSLLQLLIIIIIIKNVIFFIFVNFLYILVMISMGLNENLLYTMV